MNLFISHSLQPQIYPDMFLHLVYPHIPSSVSPVLYLSLILPRALRVLQRKIGVQFSFTSWDCTFSLERMSVELGRVFWKVVKWLSWGGWGRRKGGGKTGIKKGEREGGGGGEWFKAEWQIGWGESNRGEPVGRGEQREQRLLYQRKRLLIRQFHSGPPRHTAVVFQRRGSHILETWADWRKLTKVWCNFKKSQVSISSTVGEAAEGAGCRKYTVLSL